ncbi:MAG: D-alanyl-D-alanine carboxypeptidase family protein [Actinomycetota bacterium]
MTTILGALAVSLALALAGFAADIAQTSATRARAQLAADAAALAAVAESAPYGDGDPERQAAQVARDNGASLIDCLCPVGTTAVQVKVAVDGVTADARATIDPTAFFPLAATTGTGLHPVLDRAVQRLLDAAGGRVTLISGWRSTVHQQELWADALRRYGSAEIADDWVARPGSSMHERGLAVDLGGEVEHAADLAEALGLPLQRPLPHEPWHFELTS